MNKQIQFNLAFTYLDRAIELSDPNSTVRIKCGNTRGLSLVAMGEWTTAGCEPEHTRRLGAICHRSMIAEQAEPELQVERAEPVPLAAMRAPALQRDE